MQSIKTLYLSISKKRCEVALESENTNYTIDNCSNKMHFSSKGKKH